MLAILWTDAVPTGHIAGAVHGGVTALCDAGDDGGTAEPVVTSPHAGSSTVHRPYYFLHHSLNMKHR